mgnify:FL=1
MIDHILIDKTEAELETLFASDPTQLTYIAEDAGKVSKDYAILICSVAICHEKDYVREGALYGLSLHIDDPDVRAMVTYVAEHDVSQTVREIAAEILEEW